MPSRCCSSAVRRSGRTRESRCSKPRLAKSRASFRVWAATSLRSRASEMTSDLLTGFGIAACAVHVGAGLIFISAGAKKLLHWQEFRGVVADYRLLPASSATVMAAIIPPFELLLGVASIVRWGMPLTALVVAAMLTLFAAAMAI